jgi:hypothetical protein
MSCAEIQSNKYQTRKSPPFHAKDCKDLIKKGKDGDYVSRSDIKGIYKWVKVGAKRTTVKKPRKVNGKAYQIHDNGNKPFQVVVSGKTVEIYKGKRAAGDDYDDNRNYNQLIQKLGVKNVYLGESLCGVSRISDFNCGPDTIGNVNCSLAIRVNCHSSTLSNSNRIGYQNAYQLNLEGLLHFHINSHKNPVYP